MSFTYMFDDSKRTLFSVTTSSPYRRDFHGKIELDEIEQI